MWYVYLLKSIKNEDVYVGFCKDLRVRYKRHADGFVTATKYNRPWRLVYYEGYYNKKDATKREKQLKENHKVKTDLLKQIENSLGRGGEVVTQLSAEQPFRGSNPLRVSEKK